MNISDPIKVVYKYFTIRIFFFLGKIWTLTLQLSEGIVVVFFFFIIIGFPRIVCDWDCFF